MSEPLSLALKIYGRSLEIFALMLKISFNCIDFKKFYEN